MEITSIYFGLLSVIIIFIYYFLNPRFRIIFLSVFSCAFIASYNYYLLIYILAYASINYYIGLKIPSAKHKKALYRTGIIINILQLIILRYASSVIDPFFRIFNISMHFYMFSEIIVPIGISYFTLQGIGYLINIKMGWEKPEKKYLHFLLYITFYPKFISGPIERSNHFLPQLKINQTFDEKQVVEGLKMALIGSFKKVIIANPMGILVNSVYTEIDSFGGLNLWITILVQPLYLYFDFSGYTDIAVGLAKTLGINLLPNFNKPFLSENITTFWKRFHMSLSLWFNDYMFKPLTFNFRRAGYYASVLAVFVTFVCFGIWHGGGWNFMILGLIQAIAVNFEFFTKKVRHRLFSKLPVFYRTWVGRAITYIFFGGSLIFFFSPDVDLTLKYISKLKTLDLSTNYDVSVKLLFFAFICSIVFILQEILNNEYKVHYSKLGNYWRTHKFVRIIIYYFFIILILSHLSGELSFIYQMF